MARQIALFDIRRWRWLMPLPLPDDLQELPAACFSRKAGNEQNPQGVVEAFYRLKSGNCRSVSGACYIMPEISASLSTMVICAVGRLMGAPTAPVIWNWKFSLPSPNWSPMMGILTFCC
jgi:hypothetical protein